MLMASPTSSQEVATESAKHSWSRIVYPFVEGRWGVDHKLHPAIVPSADLSGWQFELTFAGSNEQLDSDFLVPVATRCDVQLHTAAGQVQSPTGDLVVDKTWDPMSQTWLAKVSWPFAWTRNEFDEAWVELRTEEQIYYFEIPYGFTRDLRSELCPSSPSGPPEISDSIRPIGRDTEVVWWHHVEYDFGELETGWQVLCWVSNSQGTHCSVMIRPLTDDHVLPKHLSRITARLRQSGGQTRVSSHLLGTLYPISPDFTSDSVTPNFSSRSDDERSWGEIELSYGDQTVKTLLPSSLFYLGHGIPDYERQSKRPRFDYGPPEIDPQIPYYKASHEEVEADIRVGGLSSSDWLFDPLTDSYDDFRVDTAFAGNADGFRALVNGEIDLVLVNALPPAEEVRRFVEKFGQEPCLIPIAIKRYGIFVHPENPLTDRGLSLAEADAIFSTSRHRGHVADISDWRDLGLEGEWLDQPIRRYAPWSAPGFGRANDPASYFERIVIRSGETKSFERRPQTAPTRTVEIWTSGPVSDNNFGVDDKFGISYGVVLSRHEGFKAVPIGQPPVYPSAGNCYRGDYPLTERVSIVVSPIHLDPDSRRITTPAIREILKLLLSRQGQMAISQEADYLTLSYDLASESAMLAGIDLPMRESHLDVPPAIAGVLSQTYPQEDHQSLVLELSAPVTSDLHSFLKASHVIERWRRSRCFDPLMETVEFYGDSRSAVSAAVALVSLGRSEYWAELRGYSKHNHHELRSWLIHEIRDLRNPEGVDILVDMIGDETEVAIAPRRTISDEATEALCVLTGQDFGRDALRWREWWDTTGRAEFSSDRGD